MHIRLTRKIEAGQGRHVGQYHHALAGQALMPGQTQVAQIVQTCIAAVVALYIASKVT